ncbi:uncharacterized protein LOC127138049 [Lathyrus oleraceus]|uniref:uncharacterized protein LOC127138049 n=1 Tax=Pisum sativum TaxID=3888 RepID=UPI0021D39EA2|nr:uncharacterized protein LOC127138049 [Pisum sativum]
MAWTKVQKAQFDTQMVLEEAEDLWDNVRQRLEVISTKITWVVFKAYFLEKYFPEYIHSKKEIEFLELKQGNSTVVEYAAKFEELVKFCPHYNNVDVEGLKCIKLESRLHPEIKQGIGYQDFRPFSVLGHTSTQCEKPKKDQSRGKVFALSGADTTAYDSLIRVFAMSGSMVIDTPTNGLVTTSLVCLNCPLTIYGRNFGRT